MCNSRVERGMRATCGAPRGPHLGFFGNHTSDLPGIAFFSPSDVRRNIAAPPSHKQHSSNLASASLHPHVDIEFSLHYHTPTPPLYDFTPHNRATPLMSDRRFHPPTFLTSIGAHLSRVAHSPCSVRHSERRDSIPPICRETCGGQGRADASFSHHGTSNFWRRGDSLIKRSV